jgi:hypothetical protein
MRDGKDVDKAIEAAVDNNASVAGMVNELLAHGIGVAVMPTSGHLWPRNDR